MVSQAQRLAHRVKAKKYEHFTIPGASCKCESIQLLYICLLPPSQPPLFLLVTPYYFNTFIIFHTTFVG